MEAISFVVSLTAAGPGRTPEMVILLFILMTYLPSLPLRISHRTNKVLVDGDIGSFLSTLFCLA